jgi:hypothetical protein
LELLHLQIFQMFALAAFRGLLLFPDLQGDELMQRLTFE